MITSIQELKTILIVNSIKIAVAESLTCGTIQKIIGGVSGASEFFEGGITAYSLDQKVNILNVCREEAENTNCVSTKVADQMALGVCQLFHVKVAVSTTGYAEPDIGNSVKNPFAHISVCINESIYHKKITMESKSRIESQNFVSEFAISFLLDCIKNRM